MHSDNEVIAEGCVHGRFQPPHLEHMEYIQAALERVQHLLIGIAQPDAPKLDACEEDPHRALAADNPLNFLERCEAIERMLTHNGVDRRKYSFIKFPIDRPELLIQYVPKSVVCLTTIRDDWNLKKIDKLRLLGYDIVVLWNRSSKKGISGTEIRKQIRDFDDIWQESVHPAVTEFLISEGLVDRMRRD